MARPLVIVDVEATSATPASGVMTEFGAVELVTERTWYARLWPFTPHPDAPALPVVAADARPDIAVVADGVEVAAADGAEVAREFDRWVRGLSSVTSASGRGVATFVSDNPAFDWMWIADLFDRTGLANPFGFSARRIGDLAAGLSGNWRNTNAWKSLRRTPHDHNPTNDALGNAEALRELLARHNQKL